MIRTRICDLLGIEHPIVLGGMATGTSAPLVAAVSNAGGFGTIGLGLRNEEEVPGIIDDIRERTEKPFGVNFLLFRFEEAAFAAALAAKPPVVAFAWPRADQDLRSLFDRAHEAGAKVMFQAGEVADLKRAAEAGADVIVVQGTEGGGHVGWMATLPLLPMAVDAVAPVPVLAAGGIADGRGLAAALALGGEGVLLGTRFLATEESPIHPNFKEAIVASDGHDTLLTEIPDIVLETVWPGAMSRALRNDFIERWAGKEWALRQHQAAAFEKVQAAGKSGDAAESRLLIGQDAGLIHDIPPAGELVRRIAAEAEEILAKRLPSFLQAG